jgi:chromosome segregation ATPase
MATPQVAQDPSVDSLANLEERITRAVQIITALRGEKAELQKSLQTTQDELGAATAAHAEAEVRTSLLQTDQQELTEKAKRQAEEIEDLREERKQVRTRIEKLLSQLDLLSAS